MARLFSRPSQPSRTRSSMPLTLPVSLLVALHSRKARYRSALLVVGVLLFISTYILLIRPTFSPSYALAHQDTPASEQLAVALESARNSRLSGTSRKHKKLFRSGDQIKLDPSQELAAISSFLASLPHNIIPSSVDPSVTIDPQLVLDFDTRSSRAKEELYSPASREVKAMLARMNLRPAPTIIDVDIRDDAEVLQPIVYRLTSSSELPVLLIGGKPVGTIEEIRLLDASGELRKLVANSGAVIDGVKRKKHKH
ncbi:hypothetical protein H0H81_004272 [Sphagnurus paluster]|uniref:Uncharacterized protein n=1 Tax=Sphagnurus paluster TaxID=117069 RepID=A0A9P7FUS4_9AGAR|nr:hypothetical protein H0H81_004272 [Sphagnurus paluster]